MLKKFEIDTKKISQKNYSQVPNFITTFLSDPLRKMIGGTSIRYKIIGGYVLSLLIASLGATSARVVEEGANEKVEEAAEEVQEQISLLSDFHLGLLEIHDTQHRLINVFDRPQKQAIYTTEIQSGITEITTILEKLPPELHSDELGSTRETLHQLEEDLEQWFETHADTIVDYTEHLLALVKSIEAAQDDPERLSTLRQSLIEFSNSPHTLSIGDLTTQLRQLNRILIAGKNEQIHEAYEEVEVLEGNVMFGALLTALAIGIVLAFFTAQVIARPLEVTTRLAKQVTNASDFTLRAPVLSQDEAGQLTTSLNELIERVAENLKEIKQAQAQLVQSEKMSSLGRMVAGVAHEINNPVSFIHGNIQHIDDYVQDLLQLVNLYQKQGPDSPPEIQSQIEQMDWEFLQEDLPKCLSSMKVGTDRIRQIVLSLRLFSSLDEVGFKTIDLHENLDSTLLMLNSQLHDDIEVVKNYGTLPAVECYPVQLNQVFCYLLSNAIQALQERSGSPQKRIEIVTQCLEGDRVQIQIRDNGLGIPQEVQAKIFDPFFTTKDVGEGTGLGLSISYNIIQKHQGEITVQSQPGQGTEFTITLPVAT